MKRSGLTAICPLLMSWVHPLLPEQQDQSLKRVPGGQTPIARQALVERIQMRPAEHQGQQQNQAQGKTTENERFHDCASRIVQKTRKFTLRRLTQPIFQAVRLGRAKLSRNNAAALTTMDGPAGVS